MAETDRLNRIEEKIDKMAEAIMLMARFEEKLDNYEKYRDESWKRMNRFSEKLDRIEKKVDENAHTVGQYGGVNGDGGHRFLPARLYGSTVFCLRD